MTIEDGKVRVQVVHAAALGALNPVDIWVVDADCVPDGILPLAADFAFGASDSFDLDSTALTLGFDVGQDGTVDACFSVPDVGVTNDIVSVYAVNDDAGAVSLVAHLPTGDTAEITPTAL